MVCVIFFILFFFNDTATTEIYTLSLHDALPISYFENPDFHITNSIKSLWYARDLLEDDVLLLNGDLYYEHDILDYAINQTNPVVMLADSTRIDKADYRFGFSGNQINRFGKHLTNHETDGEYVGIVRIDQSFIKTFKQTLEEMITSGKSNIWWEDVLYSFIEKQIPIHYFDVAGTFWSEVDTLQDRSEEHTSEL